MFDKEKFHNLLALNLGYERILKDKRVNIKIDEIDDKCSENPKVMIEVFDTPIRIEFKASESFKDGDYHKQIKALGMYNEIHAIIDAVHTAYLESTKDLVTF